MELIERMTPDFSFPDERGLLVQIAHDNFRQVNAVFTKQGAVRGNFHYHKETDEVFFVLSGRVRVTAGKDGRTQEAVFGAGEMFRIGAWVRHSFAYLEDTSLVVLYSVPVERADGTKDIYTDGV